MNHFTLLNLPQSFTIDLAALESAYFAAQREFHPDRVARLDASAQLAATKQSVAINDAYQTLKHPLKRAKYLLELQAITVLDEANTAKPDMAILHEIMELQEQLQEADTADKHVAFQTYIEELKNSCIDSLTHAFEKNDFESAKTSTIRLSYLYKLA